MDPALDRGRIYFHAALLHHLGQIAKGDPVVAVPANTRHDDLNRKTSTLEHEPSQRLYAAQAPGTVLKQQRPFPGAADILPPTPGSKAIVHCLESDRTRPFFANHSLPLAFTE